MTEQKKSVLSHLAGLFVEQVPDQAAPKASASTPAPAPTPIPLQHPVGHASSTPDPQVLAKLEARLQSALPPAYASFMEQYDVLKDDIPDERTRFKVALKTSHTTADQVVSALDQLLGTMGTALTDFMHTFDENKEKRLGEAQKSITATDDLISSHEAQLKSITDTITSLRTKRSTDVESMETETHRLEGIRAGFEGAHSQIVARLTSQKNHILPMPKV